MAIISRLEKEPWQPDLLLERQSDKTSSPNPFLSSSSSSTTTAATAAASSSNINGTTTTKNNGLDEPSTNTESTTAGGFQGVIPVIIKSPSSVITTADSDCVESIFEDHSSKIPGIQEYLQQTHQEQLLLQQQRLQQQQEVQLQLQYQLPSHLVQQNKINNSNATAANNAATINNSSSSSYTNSTNTNNNTRRQTSQQYRNSFHGHSAPFLGLDEHRSSLISRPLSIHEPQARCESPLSKVVTDNEVIGSNKTSPLLFLLLFFCCCVLICLHILFKREGKGGSGMGECTNWVFVHLPRGMQILNNVLTRYSYTSFFSLF